MPAGVSGITQEAIDRIVVVIYVQDAVPETLEATAQWRHDNRFRVKYDGDYYDDVAGTGYNNTGYNKWPLKQLMNEVLMKGVHHFKVHFLGLDKNTGVITPYITDKPYGYFANKYPFPAYGHLPDNENGHVSDQQVHSRSIVEINNIFNSGYWNTYKDDNLVYDKNVAGKIDFMIMVWPPKLNDSYYRVGMKRAFASTVQIIGHEPSFAFYQQADTNTTTLMHEYIHIAYSGATDKAPLGYNVSGTYPDLYVERSNTGEAPPWGTTPVGHGSIMSTHTRQILDPMVAYFFGAHTLTPLSGSGTYRLMATIYRKDFVVVRSPRDKNVYCIFYNAVNISDRGGPKVRYGVHAFVIRFIPSWYINIPSSNSFQNHKGRPFACYVSFEMSPDNGYSEFNYEQYDGARLKRRSVLLDFATDLGIHASFNGYYGEEGAGEEAEITVDVGEEDPSIPTLTITPDTYFGGPMLTVFADVYSIINCRIPEAEVSTNPDMSSPVPLNVMYSVSNTNAYFDPDKSNNQRYSIFTMAGGTRYYRVIAKNGDITRASNIVQITTDGDEVYVSVQYRGLRKLRLRITPGEYLCGLSISIAIGGEVISQKDYPLSLWVESDPEYAEFVDLVPGTAYNITARTVYPDGYGDPYTETYTTRTIILGAIAISTAIATSAESMHVAHNKLEEGEFYDIEVYYGGQWHITNVEYDADGYDVPAPAPGQLVPVRVRAVDGIYYSSYSATVSVPIEDISTPTDLSYELDEYVNATIHWTAPDNISAPSYAVEVSLDDFATIDATIVTNDIECEYEVPFQNLLVYVRVKAAKYGAESEYSPVLTFFSGISSVPIIYSIVASHTAIRMRQSVAHGASYIIEYWALPPTGVITLEVGYRDYDVEGWIDIAGLIPGKQYGIRVKDAGEEDYSLAQYFNTPTLPVVISSCVMINDAPETRRIALGWAYPEGISGISCDIWVYTGMIVGQTPIYENLIVYRAGEATQYDIPVGALYDQQNLYVRIYYEYVGVTYGPSLVQTVYIPPMYDTPIILSVIPDYEGVRIKHYRFMGGTTDMKIEDDENETVLFVTLEGEDYDKDGYVNVEGALKAGRQYIVTIRSRGDLNDYKIATEMFETLYMGSPSIGIYREIRDDYARAALTFGGGVEGEYVKIMASFTENMLDSWEIARVEPFDEVEFTGLRSGTRYYLDLRSYKEYDDGDIISGKYSTQSTFVTFYPNNRSGEKYMSKIKDAYAEKKSQEYVLITWELLPHNYHAPYTVYRSLTGEGGYEEVGRGMGNAFIDDIRQVNKNETISYRIESLGDTAEVQLQVQADSWLLAVASDYLWQLATAANSSKAAAYLKSKNASYCTECYNEDLGKRIKSTCDTCDGSARLVSYIGPVYMRYAITQRIRDKETLADIERDREVLIAWTGNTPILNEGDIIVTKEGVKYMVQSVPSRGKMHSTINSDEFIVRQDITLRRLNDNEYQSLVYDKQQCE